MTFTLSEDTCVAEVISALEFINTNFDNSYFCKEESVTSFDTPYTHEGIFINLKTHLAYPLSYIEKDSQETNNYLYYNRHFNRVPKKKETIADEAPTKLAIGVEGGFAGESLEYVDEPQHKLYVLPSKTSIPNFREMFEGLDVLQPLIYLIDSIESNVSSESGKWAVELIKTKYAENLPLCPNFTPIPANPADWKCYQCGRDANLWVNLSDGFIGCGRKQWGMPETGCSNEREGAAITHYDDTGRKYPLAVKLRSVSHEIQKIDCYSYAKEEDDLIRNDFVEYHLNRLGMDIRQHRKTEKNLEELQVDLNKNYEYEILLREDGKKDTKYGKSLMGLKNLGNSCYMSTVLQALYSIDKVRELYCDNDSFLSFLKENEKNEKNPNFQLQKLFIKFASGNDDEIKNRRNHWIKNGGEKIEDTVLYHDLFSLSPYLLRKALANGHSEFTSCQQQDAEEYLRHIIDILPSPVRVPLSVASPASPLCSLSSLTSLVLSQKYTTIGGETKEYILSDMKEFLLPLPVPIESAEKEGAAPLPRLTFDDCMKKFLAKEQVNMRDREMEKHVYGKHLPEVLVVQVKRYGYNERYEAVKLVCSVDLPMEVDLKKYLLPVPVESGEVEMTEVVGGKRRRSEIMSDEATRVYQQLMEMGVEEAMAKRAVRKEGATLESALEWVFGGGAVEVEEIEERVEDTGDVREECLGEMLMMGIEEEVARVVLAKMGNDVMKSVDFIFNHEDIGMFVMQEKEKKQREKERAASEKAEVGNYDKVSGKYRLKGVVSHVGANTSVGHYICHVERDGSWYKINDEYITPSDPVLDLGYIYFYQMV